MSAGMSCARLAPAISAERKNFKSELSENGTENEAIQQILAYHLVLFNAITDMSNKGLARFKV
jgi:hypothetical protein